jgi:RNA ligase (TIGR02306 family)
MRKLASIQKIENVLPINGADNIVCVQILGWECVAKKTDFNVGDLCVYFEVDSFLPVRPEFEFLAKACHRFYKKTEGYRIKTVKLRGQISQGLALPLSALPETANGNFNVEDDVTDLLKVIKYDVEEAQENPFSAQLGGKSKSNFPSFIAKTDETRIQSTPGSLKKLKGNPYYISTKMDGSSSTYYYKKQTSLFKRILSFFGFESGEFGVCSRNINLKEDKKNTFWEIANKYDLGTSLKKAGFNVAIQGEVCGPGIQKNKLKLDDYELYVFNAFDIDKQEYLSLQEMIGLCDKLGVKTVPIEEVGDNFNYETVAEMLEKAKGKYPKGGNKEGIVVRSSGRASAKDRISFKAINNDFLLKDEE